MNNDNGELKAESIDIEALSHREVLDEKAVS